MDHSFRFFRNTACAYFPCHETETPETFNCLFCYCPLYFTRQCGGDGVIRPGGVKDCSGCLVPHKPENYGHIIQRLKEAIRDAGQEGRWETGRETGTGESAAARPENPPC